MTTPDTEFSRQFARMSASFVADLPQQVEAMTDELAAWLAWPEDTAKFEDLSQKTHRLKGAGGTFGCSGISDAARTLECQLVVLQTDLAGGSASAKAKIEAEMESLRGAVRKVCGESALSDQQRRES